VSEIKPVGIQTEACLTVKGKDYKFATLEHLRKGVAVCESDRQLMQMASVVYNHETMQFDKHRYCGHLPLNRLLNVARLVGINAVKECAEIFGHSSAIEMVAEMEPYI
jgi:hypothetical protein